MSATSTVSHDSCAKCLDNTHATPCVALKGLLGLSAILLFLLGYIIDKSNKIESNYSDFNSWRSRTDYILTEQRSTFSEIKQDIKEIKNELKQQGQSK
jgi:hypothetical protein